MDSDEATDRNSWSKTPLRLLNLLAFIPLIVGNALAGAGALSGASIGEIANRWQTLLLPASWAFGIWSLIYLWLAAFLVYQMLPRENAGEVAGRIGSLWLSTVVLNLAWITAFSFSRFALALAAMLALLVSLILVFMRLDVGGRPVRRAERLLVQAPFSLYLGWIIVALIVNAAQYLTYLGWEGGPISPLLWTLTMMVAATAIAALFDVLRGEWIVALVVAWALFGVGARYPDRTELAAAAWGLASVNVLFPFVFHRWHRRRRREGQNAAA